MFSVGNIKQNITLASANMHPHVCTIGMHFFLVSVMLIETLVLLFYLQRY